MRIWGESNRSMKLNIYFHLVLFFRVFSKWFGNKRTLLALLCLPACNSSSSNRFVFVKVYVGQFYKKCIQLLVSQTKKWHTLHEDLHTFKTISCHLWDKYEKYNVSLFSGWHSSCLLKQNHWRTRYSWEKGNRQSGWMVGYRWEYVKTVANYTNLAYLYNKFSKGKKIEIFSPTILRGFPA